MDIQNADHPDQLARHEKLNHVEIVSAHTHTHIHSHTSKRRHCCWIFVDCWFIVHALARCWWSQATHGKPEIISMVMVTVTTWFMAYEPTSKTGVYPPHLCAAELGSGAQQLDSLAVQR